MCILEETASEKQDPDSLIHWRDRMVGPRGNGRQVLGEEHE